MTPAMPRSTLTYVLTGAVITAGIIGLGLMGGAAVAIVGALGVILLGFFLSTFCRRGLD